MNSPLAYAGLMFVAGVGIPVMAALNARLGVAYGNVALAASILFCVAFLCSTTVLLFNGLPEKLSSGLPAYHYLAGVLVAFYVLSITFAAPRFGIANAVFFVLLGQIIASALIDHFGLFGAPQSSLTVQRGVGIVLMAVGVFLARKLT